MFLQIYEIYTILAIPDSLNNYMFNQRGCIYQKEITEKGYYFVLGGKQINRFSFNKDFKGKIRKNIVVDQKAFINTNSILAQRIVAHIGNPFPHLKIIATLSDCFDTKNCIIVDTINQLTNKSSLSTKFLLSIINSKLISGFSYRFIFANAIRTMQFDNPTTSKIPIPKTPNPETQKELIRHVETMLQLNKDLQNAKLPEQKEQIKARLDYTDKKIDNLVYELYGLTEEEIRIVDGEG